jgi:hypothetical protein
VAELEKEVESMRALFVQKKNDSAHISPGHSNMGVPIATKVQSYAGTPNGLDPSILETTSSSIHMPNKRHIFISDQQDLSAVSSSSDLDVIDRGVLTWEVAEELFHIFINDLFPHYPCVYFAPGTSPEKTRRKKPILFLAVIAAASGKTDPHLYSMLHSEVVAAYAQRTIIHGEKSLELVQAQIVTSIWYYPPGRFSRLKFYQYIHMATTMAMDIGIGTNPNPSRKRYGVDLEEPSSNIEPDSAKLGEELEKRRTILTCYLISTE